MQLVTVRKATLRKHASRKFGLVWRRFLDVGSGCGVLTAAAALLVGRSGASVGIDTKRCAAELGAANVARLATECQEYADTAAAAAFHMHNVFIPTARHKVRFLSSAVRCENTCWQSWPHLHDISRARQVLLQQAASSHRPAP